MTGYTQWDEYFWADGPNVLANKLGIRDQELLNFVEAQLTAVRIAELVTENKSGPLDFARYCDIHRRIFQDVYDWAGQPRTVPAGPMTKQGPDVENFAVGDPNATTVTYLYHPGPKVRENAEYAFGRLQAENGLAGLSQDRFIARLGLH